MLSPWKKNDDKCRQHIKKQRYCLANKGLFSQSYGFSSSYVWMWNLNIHWKDLMQKADSLEKTLMLGKIEGKRRRGRQRMRYLGDVTDSMDMSLSKLWEKWRTGKPGVVQFMGSQRVGHNLVTKQQIKKNEIMPFAAMWVQLEMIVVSEVSQRDSKAIWYHLNVEPEIWCKWICLWNRKRIMDREQSQSPSERGLGRGKLLHIGWRKPKHRDLYSISCDKP